MNGALDPAPVPATAGRASAKRQSGSPANRNARDFVGIFFNNAAGCKAVRGRIQARRQRGKIILQKKSLVTFAWRVKFGLPNENWAPRRVTAI
jgi:hypothetical protein